MCHGQKESDEIEKFFVACFCFEPPPADLCFLFYHYVSTFQRIKANERATYVRAKTTTSSSNTFGTITTAIGCSR
jgi:hypothetical protein